MAPTGRSNGIRKILLGFDVLSAIFDFFGFSAIFDFFDFSAFFVFS
jgi:hypothetical protein